ncbi:hypothetical protein ElyMa_006971000, partial [Elysia marginata]
RPYKQLTERELQIEPNSLFTPPTSIFRKPLEAEFDDELSASVGRNQYKDQNDHTLMRRVAGPVCAALEKTPPQ